MTISAADMEVLNQIEKLTSALSESLQDELAHGLAGALLRRAKDEGPPSLSRMLIDLLEIDGIVIFWMHKNVGRSEACSLRVAPAPVERITQLMHGMVTEAMTHIGHNKERQ